MPGRVERMEARLKAHPEGVALAEDTGLVPFSNRPNKMRTESAGFEIVARAKAVVLSNLHAGGNPVPMTPGRQTCLRS